MILKSLVNYYSRKAASPTAEIASPGFESKEMQFLLILDEKGHFIDLVKGEKKFKVPKGVKRTKNICPNYLWDNRVYLFDSKIKRNAFRDRVKNGFPELSQNEEIKAVLTFLESDSFSLVEKHPLWKKVEPHSNIAFKIEGRDHLVCQKEEVIHAVATAFHEKGGHKGICLVTGEPDSIVRLHHSIKGVPGAHASGTNLISFNCETFNSYGKEQGSNAPIGEYACFAYTTALNTLLESSQKIHLGLDATVLFWTEEPHPFEHLFPTFFNFPLKENLDRLEMAFPFQGDKTKLHILIISPNDARLMVRFWTQCSVGDMVNHLKLYFDDLKIEKGSESSAFFPFYYLLQGVAICGEIKNLPPNFSTSLLMSVMSGTSFPYSLLPMILNRLKDKEGVSQRRAAIIKAWINRYTRKVQNHEKELLPTLDHNNSNPGYCLGRLFAYLEKVKGIHKGLYRLASTMPRKVFAHALKSQGKETFVESIVEELKDIPSHLLLPDQGRFAIGYYHQQQSF